MKTDQKEIGVRIKAILKKKGMTQRALAESLGTTDTTVSNYIKGTAGIPTAVYALVAELGGVSIDWLITGRETDVVSDVPVENIQPLTIAEQIGEGYGPEVKLMADYLEVKIKGKTAEERLQIVEEIMEQIRNKYK